MLRKIIRFFEKHPIKFFILIFIVVLVVPTTIIHIVYIIPTDSKWTQVTIPAGNMLAYVGTVLTFCATFMLSIMVYLSNKRQSEMLMISQNKAMLVVNNDKEVKINIPEALKNRNEEIEIELELKILSNALISRMKVVSFDVTDCDYPKDSNRTFLANCGKGKEVEFQYKSRDTLIIKFNSNDKKLQEILCTSTMLAIWLDMVVTCENVKTVLNIMIRCASCKVCEECSFSRKEFDIKNSESFVLDSYIC